MKTTIKTTVKDNNNITINETPVEMLNLLTAKDKYIVVTKIEHSGKESMIILDKATIKMVKGEKE